MSFLQYRPFDSLRSIYQSAKYLGGKFTAKISAERSTNVTTIFTSVNEPNDSRYLFNFAVNKVTQPKNPSLTSGSTLAAIPTLSPTSAPPPPTFARTSSIGKVSSIKPSVPSLDTGKSYLTCFSALICTGKRLLKKSEDAFLPEKPKDKTIKEKDKDKAKDTEKDKDKEKDKELQSLKQKVEEQSAILAGM